ncbi:MAG: acyltransferase family protein, partial [Acutalibacteraceae bacterium]|nr:acyltransferase family protein [Acutalibacteraceae bacterium]
ISNISFATGIYPDQFMYYFLGAFFAKYKPLPKKQVKKTAIIMLVICQVIWFINKLGYKEWRYNVLYLIFCAISVYSILILMFSAEKLFVNESKLLSKFLKHSFIIFALHPFIIEIFQKIIYLIFPHNEVTAICDFVLSPVLTITLCVLFGNIINKICPKFYSLITGGR